MVKLPQPKSTIKDSYTGSSTKNAQFYDPPPPIIHKNVKNEKQICFLKPIESKHVADFKTLSPLQVDVIIVWSLTKGKS